MNAILIGGNGLKKLNWTNPPRKKYKDTSISFTLFILNLVIIDASLA